MNNINKTIGSRVRTLRQKRGWTLEFISKKLQITPEYLSYLERGNRRWNIELLEKIAKLFDISLALLLDEKVDINNVEELSNFISECKKLNPSRLRKVRKLMEVLNN